MWNETIKKVETIVVSLSNDFVRCWKEDSAPLKVRGKERKREDTLPAQGYGAKSTAIIKCTVKIVFSADMM